MKKSAVIFALTLVSMAIILPFTVNLQTVHAQEAYSIQNVDHKIEILYSGHVVITETIQLQGQSPSSFLIGFPNKYSSSVLKGTAYDSSNNVLPMTLGVQLQDQVGFYGASINLPSGSSQNFTVVFILSNSLLTPTFNGFSLDFPAYPSFVQNAVECSVTLALTSDITGINIEKNDGAVNTTTYTRSNLPAFTYSPATATFSVTTTSIQKIEVNSLNREVTISPQGEITCTDRYRITNMQASTLSFVALNIPTNASNIVTRDQFGRTLETNIITEKSQAQTANITLILPMRQNESDILTIGYNLPRTAPQQPNLFALNPQLFPWTYYYVQEASVTFIPPEGARFVAPTLSSSETQVNLVREAFQETLSVNRKGVSYVDQAIPSQSTVELTFEYSPLWTSFRPASWMWTIAVVGCVIVALWTRPKAKAPARIVVSRLAVGLSPEHVKAFTDAYEEKNRILSELKSLEARAQRGRIPRRRYKVQRRTSELRLNALTQTIAELKDVLRSAGGSYAEYVKQVETAEIELEEVELGIRTIEARHARGELPLEAYRKQLADFERRREKAETAVSGLLLRMRGEIR